MQRSFLSRPSCHTIDHATMGTNVPGRAETAPATCHRPPGGGRAAVGRGQESASGERGQESASGAGELHPLHSRCLPLVCMPLFREII